MSSPTPAARVVFDTNVVLSALLFRHGAVARLREVWRTQRCVPLVNAHTAGELVRVLAYPKFKLTADDQRELLADYLPWAATVQMPAKLPTVPACRDPHDVPFLHLAVVGRSALIVSGDDDLWVLDRVGKCRIVKPADFLGGLAV